MVFQNTRNTRLKNHIIDFNDNTIINFPFGKAPELANKFITDIKIADNAGIKWSKISKLGSKIEDLENTALSNVQLNQVIGWDGSGRWVPIDFPSTSNPWDPTKSETITNKTMDFGANTFTSFPYITPSSTNTLTNKTMDFASNTLTNLPSVTKLPDGTSSTRNVYGRFWGGAGNGDGLMSGMTINATSVTTEQTASEQYTVFNSDVVDGALGGFSSFGKITRRDYNPTYKIKFHTTSSTERIFAGFADITGSTLTGDDSPLDGHTGAGILFSDTVNNFTVMWNNGSATGQTFATTTAKNTSAHTLIITIDNTLGTVVVTFDGTVVVNSSTAVPGATTGMYLHSNYESIGTSGANLAVSYAYLLQDH